MGELTVEDALCEAERVLNRMLESIKRKLSESEDVCRAAQARVSFYRAARDQAESTIEHLQQMIQVGRSLVPPPINLPPDPANNDMTQPAASHQEGVQ